ncbi:hypothetical protein [Nocardioides sp. LHG3406-4]|uniref:hypothetical protein n=1 Tax=Nocardioides sp. LHG3406-4 TaxID=2804575 RepID=UPI003CF9571E
MLQTTETPRSVVRPLTGWQTALLVAAPAVAVFARLLLTPWYQDDSDQPDNVRFLGEIAGSTLRNDIGAMLTLASAVLFAGAAMVVGLLARQHLPRVAAVGTGLATAGAFGLAMFADQLVIVGQAARLHGQRPAMVELLDQAYSAPQSGVSYLMLILGAAGWALLGFSLYRGRIVPRAAAVLTGVGGAAVMLTAPGPLTSFIAGAAVVSLIGLGWVALAARPARA